MAKHALLSASSADRWLNCPPSARLCESYEDKVSDYAAEGTDAHTLCEYKLKTALSMESEKPELKHYNEEMEECADGYVTYILELLESAKKNCSDPQILIEQRLDFSKYVKDGFGTGDCVIITDGTIHVIDYKHGKGVLVEAQDNSQMWLYGLGVLLMFDDIYDITEVSMTIYQPRRDNISTQTVSKEEIYQWVNEILMPAAELAFSGNGNYKCGEWCRFCKAKYECRQRADHNLELAKYDFKKPLLLEDNDIERILEKIDSLTAWAEDIKSYAFEMALKGKKWNGWKIVESRSNRKFTDEEAVAKLAKSKGYNNIYKTKLIGVLDMEKLLGKEKFKKILSKFVVKPKGKPTLVPNSDKRSALNISTAAEDFAPAAAL